MDAKLFVPRRITLTFYDRRGTVIGLSWYSEVAGTPEVRYVTAEGTAKLWDINFSAAKCVRGSVRRGIEGFQNLGLLADIPQNTDVYYQVGDRASNVWSEISCIRRRVPKDGSFTFLFMTDTQDDSENRGRYWSRALAAALEAYPEAAFLLHGGDIVQAGGVGKMWQDMLEASAPYTHSLPILQASGNHEYWRNYLQGYRHVLSLHYHFKYPPQNTENGVYYAREFGDCLFLIFNSGDSMETGGALTASQLAWAEKELQNTRKKWRITLIHNPLYSPGKYGSSPGTNEPALQLRKQLNPLFARYGVQLCLCGHDHLFMRTRPIDGLGRPAERGTVHMMAGCAGVQYREAENISDREWAFFEEYSPMRPGYTAYAAIEVSDHEITVSYYTLNCEQAGAIPVMESRFRIS